MQECAERPLDIDYTAPSADLELAICTILNEHAVPWKTSWRRSLSDFAEHLITNQISLITTNNGKLALQFIDATVLITAFNGTHKRELYVSSQNPVRIGKKHLPDFTETLHRNERSFGCAFRYLTDTLGFPGHVAAHVGFKNRDAAAPFSSDNWAGLDEMHTLLRHECALQEDLYRPSGYDVDIGGVKTHLSWQLRH